MYSEEIIKEQFIQENNAVKLNCIKNAVNYFEIKNNYIDDINKVYKWLDEKIKLFNK